MTKTQFYKIREKLGKTREQLAIENHVTTRTITNWTNGDTKPNEKDLFWMKKKLKYPIDTVK